MGKPATPLKGAESYIDTNVVQLPPESLLEAATKREGRTVSAAAPELDATPAAVMASSIGRDIIGPLCYGFVHWLIQRVREQGITQLYFLSRDGWLLKQAFDALPEEATAGLSSHYLYSSRRAVWFASLDENTGEAEFNEMLAGASPFVPVAEFLHRIFIEPQECLAEIQEAGFANEQSIVETASDKQKLYSLFQKIKPKIEANAADERADYLAYLKAAGVLSNKKAALVDVGWTGSIIKYTRALVKRVDPSLDLHGYFIGVGRNAEAKYKFSRNGCLHGYLFAFDDAAYRDIAKCFFVVEKFLSPDEPSVIRMRRGDMGFYPVYKDGEREYSPLNPIVQKSALEFVHSYSRAHSLSEPFDRNCFLPKLRKLLSRPEREVAELLSRYSYSSDFGYQARPQSIASSFSSSEYLRKPLLLLKGYRRAIWKAGYIAQQPWPARAALRGMKFAKLDHGFERLLAWGRKRR